MENPRGYGPPPGTFVPLQNHLPAQAPHQLQEDRSHLKLLGTLTLIYAGMLTLGALFVLAVFTFIVLGRSSVTALYERRTAATPQPTPPTPAPRNDWRPPTPRTVTPRMPMTRVATPRWRVATPT